MKTTASLRNALLALSIMLFTPSGLVAKPSPFAPSEETKPTPVPGWKAPEPGEHPRLLFRKSDLPALRARAETPEGKAIIARLRELLGNNGEALPTVFNTHLPRNNGPQGQQSLPIGTFTFTHPVGYGLLYQLTGDEKYADLAKQSLELMFDVSRRSFTGQQLKEMFDAEGSTGFTPKGPRWEGKELSEVVFHLGESDRDERYTWTFPGAGLRTGVMLGWLGLAYDLNYDGWDEDFRRKVQKEILETEHQLVDYQRYAEGAKRPTIGLEDCLLGTTFQPTSNHMPARVGGATMALLALRGDPGVDTQKVEDLLEKAETRVQEAFSGFNNLGWFAEGYGPSHMAANTVFAAMLNSSRNAWGKDFVKPDSKARWLTMRWPMLAVPDADGEPWYPNLHVSTYGGPTMGHELALSDGGYWSEGFGALNDPKDKAAHLWLWNRSYGKTHTDFDAAVYPHRAVSAFVNWPIGEPEINPSEVLPRAVRCPVTLHYLARNGWEGPDDILFQFLINPEKLRGNIRTTDNGIVTLYGLGERHEFHSMIRSNEGSVSETLYEASPDGSSVIGLSRDGTIHGIAVDFSPDNGIPGVIAFANPWFSEEKVRGGKGVPGIRNEKTTKLKVHSLQSGETKWIVFTFDPTGSVAPTVEGDSIKVGNRQYTFDGQRVSVATVE